MVSKQFNQAYPRCRTHLQIRFNDYMLRARRRNSTTFFKWLSTLCRSFAHCWDTYNSRRKEMLVITSESSLLHLWWIYLIARISDTLGIGRDRFVVSRDELRTWKGLNGIVHIPLMSIGLCIWPLKPDLVPSIPSLMRSSVPVPRFWASLQQALFPKLIFHGLNYASPSSCTPFPNIFG